MLLRPCDQRLRGSLRGSGDRPRRQEFAQDGAQLSLPSRGQLSRHLRADLQQRSAPRLHAIDVAVPLHPHMLRHRREVVAYQVDDRRRLSLLLRVREYPLLRIRQRGVDRPLHRIRADHPVGGDPDKDLRGEAKEVPRQPGAVLRPHPAQQLTRVSGEVNRRP